MTDATTTDPFSQRTNEDQVNYLAEMTAKFNKDGNLDVDGLARGKYEADKFIENLKKENDELRRKADQGMAVKDLLEAIKSTPQGNTEPNRDTQQAPNPPNTDDLARIVKDTISQTENERKEAQNKATVVLKLNEEWGSNSTTELAKKAQELGMTIKRLEEIGKESPQALFNILGIGTAVRAPGSTNVPTSRVSLPSTSTGDRTKKYYDELYRTNPKAKYDPKIAAQEHRDAIRLGPNFFDN